MLSFRQWSLWAAQYTPSLGIIPIDLQHFPCLFPFSSLSFSSQLQQNTSKTKPANSIAFPPLLSISFEASATTVSPLVRVNFKVPNCFQHAVSDLLSSSLVKADPLYFEAILQVVLVMVFNLPSLNLSTTLPELNLFLFLRNTSLTLFAYHLDRACKCPAQLALNYQLDTV